MLLPTAYDLVAMRRKRPFNQRVERLRLLAKLVVLFCCKAILLLLVLQLPAEGNLKSAEAEMVELCRVCEGQPSLSGQARPASRIPLFAAQPSPRVGTSNLSCTAELGCFLTPEARLPLRL